jgi:hypothetical protein
MITDCLGPVSFGLFLLAVLGTFAMGAALVLALLLKRSLWTRWITRIELGGLALYAALFFGTSLTSRTRELLPGQEKHICEVDCHLAYAVVAVDTTGSYEGRTAHGEFYVVTVRVRFDSNTIASWRPRDLPLRPNGRMVSLIDAQGHHYPASAATLARRLVPGESYATRLVFDVPPEAAELRLILASGDWPTRLMIGHENAFLHGKVLFRLAA